MRKEGLVRSPTVWMADSWLQPGPAIHCYLLISLADEVFGGRVDTVGLADFVELIERITGCFGTLSGGCGFAFFFGDRRGLDTLVDFAIFRNPGCESFRGSHFMVRLGRSDSGRHVISLAA